MTIKVGDEIIFTKHANLWLRGERATVYKIPNSIELQVKLTKVPSLLVTVSQVSEEYLKVSPIQEICVGDTVVLENTPALRDSPDWACRGYVGIVEQTEPTYAYWNNSFRSALKGGFHQLVVVESDAPAKKKTPDAPDLMSVVEEFMAADVEVAQAQSEIRRLRQELTKADKNLARASNKRDKLRHKIQSLTLKEDQND